MTPNTENPIVRVQRRGVGTSTPDAKPEGRNEVTITKAVQATVTFDQGSLIHSLMTLQALMINFSICLLA